ncbi:S-adenosyl-L-methionine-dependent methyltransferase [Syncephalis plumigaleata]|nr:S-adenosyl-L-methionine-dependent methyltransferase [Syncephalis plumigaleata]
MSSIRMKRALPSLPAVRDLVRIYGLRAKSELSQNFILDKNVTDKILSSAKLDFEDALVVEVGPGPGLLTRSILDAGAERVVVIEKDTRFLPSLKQLADACSPGRLQILSGDALQTTHASILSTAFPNSEEQATCRRVHLLGNLPFNIASPLLISWLRSAYTHTGLFGLTSSSSSDSITHHNDLIPWTMTLMFQKEVAERIVASAGSSTRSRLSVMTQTASDARITYNVPANVFVPKPKVDAAVVQLRPTMPLLIHAPFIYLEDLVRYTFTKRRKTMRHIMRHLIKDANSMVDEMLNDLDGEDVSNKRPQELSVEAFCQLADRCYAVDISIPNSAQPRSS